MNLYVQLGRGRDYAWSATSAGQDIIDTFAVDLCDRREATLTDATSAARACRSRCSSETNRWIPTPADQTPPGTQTLHAERTKLGLVAGRGDDQGQAGAFTKLRSTYFHEVDSAAGFTDFNDARGRTRRRRPSSARRRRSATRSTGSTPTPKHIAYFNSGANPVRAEGRRPRLPGARRKFEWRGWNPDDLAARFTPLQQHPQAVDQPYLINWNNKQAPGLPRAPTPTSYSSTYRSVMLEDRLKPAIRGKRKLDAAEADRRDGDGGHDATCARTPTCRWRCSVIGQPRTRRCAPAVARAARVADGRRPAPRPQPRRRLRARRRGPDHGRVVAAAGAGAVPSRVLGTSAFDAARRRPSRSTTRPTTTATTSARPTRAPGTATCARTCARSWAPRSRAATRASTAAGQPEALPHGAASLAEGRASRCRRRRSTAATRSARRRASDGDQGASTRSASARSAARPSR